MRLLDRTGTSQSLADSKGASTAKDKEFSKIGDELRDILVRILVCVVYEIIANRFKDAGKPTSIACCDFEPDVRPIAGGRVHRSPTFFTSSYSSSAKAHNSSKTPICTHFWK